MVNRNKSLNKQRQRYQSLVATALLTSSLFQFIAPVLADGTAAGQSISNTATATYQDPNDTNTTINATSNTVTVTVAEVAGITVTPVGVIDQNGGTVGGGDSLYYTYSVKNVGNDPTRFQIPNTATITGGPGAVSGNLEYSIDGGTTWISANPADPSAGITPSVPADGSILVRVPVTVQPGAVINDIITVVLGNTPTTNNGQNLPRDPDIRDIYTVDNTDPSVITGEVTGLPANGVREASATNQIKVGATIPTLKYFALATLLKTRGTYLTNATPEITDDKVSYDLSFRVESNDVTGQGITPAPLIGTSIKVDTITPETHILVSDAIPAGTALAATPTAPSGWEAVYTTDAVSTNNANVAQWKRFSTTPLANAAALATVKRVGFISNSSITAINPGQTVAGFSIQLGITGTPTTLTINNIGQLFGATPVPANSPAGTQPVPLYDESGDPNPSNYDGPLNNMTPPASTTPVNGVPTSLGTVDDGSFNNTTGIDSSGNNTGTGSNGEANTFTLNAAVAVDLLNGPQNAPDAVGPTSNNDDFSNKSSFVDPNKTFGDTIDPLPVAFINTVKNTGTATSNISLVPTTVATGTYDDALPDGTLVTINYNSVSKLYVWDSATSKFLYDADGSATTTGDRTPIDATSKYFTISVLNNATQSYGVEVNLPATTPLSTTTLKGFPVGVIAFVDNTTPGFDPLLTETYNTTINRVYTGFLKVVKLSRVLKGTGPDVGAGQDDFETTPAFGGFDPGTGADVLRTPALGNIIEYQIRYTNISAPQLGTGNAILNANNIVITEDGTKSPNNWALDNNSNGGIDTSNIVGTAKDSGTSTIQFFVGNPATTPGADQTGTTVNNDVTKYVNTVTGQVAPGVQRTFTIQRKVN